MKVRIVRKPEFTSLHHVQIKRWWWPFWSTVIYDDIKKCNEVANNLLTQGHTVTVIMQGERK